MSLQVAVVGLIVLACVAQASWTLMPSRWRASAAGALLKWPLRWPGAVSSRLRKAASGATSGCGGCDSCGSVKPDTASDVKPITIHRKSRR